MSKLKSRKFIAYIISTILFIVSIWITKTITPPAWNFMTIVTVLYMSANSFNKYIEKKGNNNGTAN